MLRRDGFTANHKRVERIYRQEGLSLRRRQKRKRLSYLRVVRPLPTATNQIWAMGVIHESLWSGRRYRALAVIDHWSRECLAIKVDVSLTGERVKRVLERLRASRGLPDVILTDNGPEFTGRDLTSGPTTTRSGCRSSSRANRSRMRSSSHSTLGCARSASTRTCSGRSMMHDRRSKPGAKIIMRCGLIARSAISLRSSSVAEQQISNRLKTRPALTYDWYPKRGKPSYV